MGHLQAGADINLQDDAGDTALHKAASTGRKVKKKKKCKCQPADVTVLPALKLMSVEIAVTEMSPFKFYRCTCLRRFSVYFLSLKEIVLLLLRYDASVDIINGTAQVPKDVTEDDEIVTMLEAAERREARQQERKLLEAAREGDIASLSKLLMRESPSNIQCKDSVGNTPLHCAAYRGQKQCVIKLLKSGANPSVKNSKGIGTPSAVEPHTVKHCTHSSACLQDGAESKQRPDCPQYKVCSQTCKILDYNASYFFFSRACLPAPMFSRNDVSIWSILKKCIGMELSKIAMPVIFNEPLSFLQRLTEYMEHTYLIHQALTTTDSIERMKCVAAFAVSAVASQWERTGKPFNPLLGETYDVSACLHHPPVSAFQAEGLKEDFVFHEAEPKGLITLELPKYNEAYTWTNPTCCVHNIIVGQLWIEQYGSVEVINHKTGERCSMTFKSCGLFGKELHKVEGYILDKSKKKLCAIYGKWTECLYTVDTAAFEAHKKSDKKNPEDKKGKQQNSVDEEPEELPPPEAETVQVIPGSELLWKITPRPENSSKYYAFSTFAMQLNELEKGMEGVIPLTDSRLRPDIRAMENGDIDQASAEKKRLEEKQRIARKNRSKSSEEWKNRWFQQGSNPHNKAQDWLYLKGYWDRNYTQLPDIY
uniref:Oxysterol binding protein like 1A n=1 Tax=Neogobius melanostomus TaxID=47308 RepID=A0A8C6UKQ8_9GOBI